MIYSQYGDIIPIKELWKFKDSISRGEVIRSSSNAASDPYSYELTLASSVTYGSASATFTFKMPLFVTRMKIHHTNSVKNRDYYTSHTVYGLNGLKLHTYKYDSYKKTGEHDLKLNAWVTKIYLLTHEYRNSSAYLAVSVTDIQGHY